MTDARIVDRGYRSYDGPRGGTPGAVRSLAWYSVLRSLGLRRSFWAKVFPIISALIAYLPAAVFVGIAGLLPKRITNDPEVLPTYHDYYGFITAAIIVFVALVGPEVLCTDRRDGMLGTYLASPLTRDSYLVAKVLAVVPVLGIVTLGPPLLLLVGLTFANHGPSGVDGFLTVLLRIVVSGVVISAAFTSLSLAVASFTDRRSVASASIILILLVTAAATSILVDSLGVSPHVLLLNLFVLPFELVQRIFGQPGGTTVQPISTVELALANLAWTVAGAAVVRERYRRLTVTR